MVAHDSTNYDQVCLDFCLKFQIFSTENCCIFHTSIGRTLLPQGSHPYQQIGKCGESLKQAQFKQFSILVITRGVFRTHSYIFFCPLVTMLSHKQNKGVITDHVERKNQKNLENPLIYSAFSPPSIRKVDKRKTEKKKIMWFIVATNVIAS